MQTLCKFFLEDLQKSHLTFDNFDKIDVLVNFSIPKVLQICSGFYCVPFLREREKISSTFSGLHTWLIFAESWKCHDTLKSDWTYINLLFTCLDPAFIWRILGVSAGPVQLHSSELLCRFSFLRQKMGPNFVVHQTQHNTIHNGLIVCLKDRPTHYTERPCGTSQFKIMATYLCGSNVKRSDIIYAWSLTLHNSLSD